MSEEKYQDYDVFEEEMEQENIENALTEENIEGSTKEIQERCDSKPLSTQETGYESMLDEEAKEEESTFQIQEDEPQNDSKTDKADDEIQYSKEAIEQQTVNLKKQDTSFQQYVKSSKTEQKSFVARWMGRLFKGALFLMLLPIFGMIGMCIIAILVAYIGLTISAAVGGVFCIGATAFLATQLTSSLIAFGIALGIAAISGSGILSILFIMLIKVTLNGIKSGKEKRLRRAEQNERFS